MIEIDTAYNILDKNHKHHIYINGLHNITYTNKYYPIITPSYNFSFGDWTYATSKQYIGDIDNIYIYNRLLTSKEIKQLYESFFVNTGSIDSEYKFVAFKNNGTNTSYYTINFSENSDVDLLLIGGGGGGGGGVVLVMIAISSSSSYDILPN